MPWVPLVIMQKLSWTTLANIGKSFRFQNAAFFLNLKMPAYTRLYYAYFFHLFRIAFIAGSF